MSKVIVGVGSIVTLLAIIFFIFSSVTTGLSGIFVYSNNTTDDKSTVTNKKSELKKLNCTIDEKTYAIKCIDVANDTDYIDITSGILVKIGYSDEVDSFGETKRYYYFNTGYDFIVNKILELNKGDYVINTLDDLNRFFNYCEWYANIPFQSISNDCLNLPKKTRNDLPGDYRRVCIISEGGFTTINDLSDLYLKLVLNKIYRNIVIDYYDSLVKKIKETKSLTVFEYIMYIACYKYINLDKYKYASICTGGSKIKC